MTNLAKMTPSQRQEFCVRWNSHLGSIGAAFPQLLAGQRFVDVTLACEGHQVHCHRLVLAACSSYFESILAENPCKHPVIILPSEIKLWEIQALVDFMYKGEVNVTQAGLPQLLRCAEQLRIRGLYGSDAALNLNQLKALTSKTAQPTTMANTTQSAELPGDSNDDDTATNSTTTTTATATSTIQHNPQQVVIKKEPMAVPQNRPVLTPVSLNSLMANPTAATNFSTHSDDESTSNAYEQFENRQNTTNELMTGGTQDELQHNMSTNPMDSTIEDDHNYVAHDEDDSFAAGMTDMEHDASANSSLLQTSLDHNNSLRRIRRSEESLEQAAKCVSKGQTFQTVSNMYNIPVSTIRFYMARKGILPKRKRGRGASSSGGGMGHSNLGHIPNSNEGFLVGSTSVIAANPAQNMSAVAATSNAASVMSQALAHIKQADSPNSNQYPGELPYHMMGYKIKPGTAHLV